MKFVEMTLEQIQQAIKAGSPEDMKAYLEQEGVEIPAKAPWNLPEETAKFGMKLWQAIMVKTVEKCADGEHDFQLTGRAEMERNAATEPGSTFRREYRCTKCPETKWESDVKAEAAAEAAGGEDAAATAGDPAAERKARIAARRAAKAAAREAAAE